MDRSRGSRPGNRRSFDDHERETLVRLRLVQLERYERQFRRLFGRPPKVEDLERALEQFDPERGFEL